MRRGLLRDRNSKTQNGIGNIVRRLSVTAAGKLLKLAGSVDGDGNQETDEAPLFGGYVFGVPAGKSEAIVVNTSARAGAPVVVATRDGDALDSALAAANLGGGDAMLFNGAALVIVRADGTIEIRSSNGIAVPLATLQDVKNLRTLVGAITVGPGAPVSSSGAPWLASAPVGTKKLVGE